MSLTIAIDFGTTQTKAAYVDQSGKPVIIPNARGEDVTPTVLYCPASGPPMIGTDAVEQGVLDPDRVMRHFKLKLGTGDNLLPGGGSPMTAREAVTLFIKEWKASAEAFLDFPITEAVVTCPADFRDDQKQGLIDGFAAAGIKVARLVAEPTAAGLAYALEKSTSNARIMVYDLGGGTFDVSILEVRGAQIDVIATAGVRELGGIHFSAALRELVMPSLNGKGDLSDPLSQFDLAQRIERAKVSLSSQREVPIIVNQTVVKITQEQFHKAVDPLIRQTLDACDRAIAEAGLTYDKIDRAILVGGAARPAYIQKCVADHTGLVPKTDIDPERAIAFGGAQAALVQMAKQGRTATLRGQVIPAPEVFIREITAHGVGCAVAEKNGTRSRLVNAVIIPKGTPIPCKRLDTFRLEDEAQTAARVEILQGDADADRDDCLLIGEIVLDNLPTEAKRSERIQVEYVIDDNGMVAATITDTVSSRKESTSIDYRKGIKPTNKPACV